MRERGLVATTLLLRKANAQAVLKAPCRFGLTTTTASLMTNASLGASAPRLSWVSRNGGGRSTESHHELPPPDNGVANTLDEAKAAFNSAYEQLNELRSDSPLNKARFS